MTSFSIVPDFILFFFINNVWQQYRIYILFFELWFFALYQQVFVKYIVYHPCQSSRQQTLKYFFFIFHFSFFIFHFFYFYFWGLRVTGTLSQTVTQSYVIQKSIEGSERMTSYSMFNTWLFRVYQKQLVWTMEFQYIRQMILYRVLYWVLLCSTLIQGSFT